MHTSTNSPNWTQFKAWRCSLDPRHERLVSTPEAVGASLGGGVWVSPFRSVPWYSVSLAPMRYVRGLLEHFGGTKD